MPETGPTLKASAWLQLVPTFNRHGKPSGMKVQAVTQKRPDRPYVGAVLVKLAVDIPASAFDPIIAAMSVDPGEAEAIVHQEAPDA